MSENKVAKDAKDLKLEEEREAEIKEDISEVIVGPKKDFGSAAPSENKQRGGGFKPRRSFKDRQENKDGFEEKVIAVDRVTRVVKGGRRMRFRTLVVVGDKNGKVGYATGKGNEVTMAVSKAVNKAKKDLFSVSIVNGSILHDVIGKSRSTRVLLKAAKKGRGIIAGGSVRTVLELAGYSDIVAKSYGSNNKINNVIATVDALTHILKKRSRRAELVNPEVKEAKKEKKAK